MIVTILGSGTSTGVPVLGKNTPVNLSKNPKDKRLRSSILVQSEEPKKTLIIDTGPDFRAQMLSNEVAHLDGVLYTHLHYDHIGGFDDLRPLSFLHSNGLDVYCDEPTHHYILSHYDYISEESPYPNKPVINFHILQKNDSGLFKPFEIAPFTIQPIEAVHVPGMNLTSVGYLINDKLLYITDFKHIKPGYEDFLTRAEVTILGAPLPHSHPSHISIDEAVEMLKLWKSPQGYITHLSDKAFHDELEQKLPENISPAFDGLLIKI